MTLAVRAVFWVIAYVGAVLAPLVFAVIGATGPDHDFGTDFSVALGFTGLAMMGLEFALVARFEPVAAPFGQDALLQFHRQIGYVGLAFVLTHFAISAHWRDVTPAKAIAAPLLVWFGMAAMLALIVLSSPRCGAARSGCPTRPGTSCIPRWRWSSSSARSCTSTSSTST
jgi:predicted ferric reductase